MIGTALRVVTAAAKKCCTSPSSDRHQQPLAHPRIAQKDVSPLDPLPMSRRQYLSLRHVAHHSTVRKGVLGARMDIRVIWWLGLALLQPEKKGSECSVWVQCGRIQGRTALPYSVDGSKIIYMRGSYLTDLFPRISSLIKAVENCCGTVPLRISNPKISKKSGTAVTTPFLVPSPSRFKSGFFPSLSIS